MSSVLIPHTEMNEYWKNMQTIRTELGLDISSVRDLIIQLGYPSCQFANTGWTLSEEEYLFFKLRFA